MELGTISAMPDDYTGSAPTYKCEKVAEFSLENGKLVPNSGVRFLNKRMLNIEKLNIDLLEGMEKTIGEMKLQYDVECQNLDDFLLWLMSVNHPATISLQKAVNGQRFVVRRGLLQRLTTSPFLHSDKNDSGFALAAVRYKGVYFLREFFSKEKENWEASREVGGYNDQCIYAGYKFEKLLTFFSAADGQNIEPKTKHNAIIAGELKSTFGPPLQILCISKVDCATREGEFIELKKLKKPLSSIYPLKALEWFMQSYLVGIKQFVAGLDRQFILQSVQKYELNKLLIWARKMHLKAEGVCLAFLHAFLASLKAELDEKPEGTILLAERPARGQQFTFRTIPIEDEEGQRRWRVLSQEFKHFGWL